MRIHFWGTRGSIPVALGAAAVRQKVRTAIEQADGRRFDSAAELDRFLDDELGFVLAGTYGGNSSCVQVDTGGDELLVFDAGSGLRELGARILADGGPGRERRINLVLSHLHWDHILGFPFFVPAYLPGNVIRIHGCHPEAVMREAFQRQQSFPCFPVDFHRLGAAIEFVTMEPGRRYEIAGVGVRAQKQHHPFDSFGYRVEKDGKAVVYSTDSEHKEAGIGPDYPQVEFLRGADVVIFDAQYSLAEATSAKEDWGHSSNIVGVELCQLAGVRHLVLFHHDPAVDDATLARVVDETRRYEALSRPGEVLQISAAYDGMEIEL